MSHLAAEGLVVTAGERRLLDGVSLRLEPGALVGLIGPNGAGKTTLLRCLAGLARPDAGTVALDGTALATLPVSERGRRIGYLPQSFQLAWDYTVREVVALGASRASGAGARIPAVLRAHDLTALADRPWSGVSGGERARTLLAATLVAEPAVLLADEPGASLDIGRRLDLMRRLRAYAREHVAVVVLHDIEQAVRDCDRLVLMDGGRVILDGPAPALAGSPEIDRIFGVRFARTPLDTEADALLAVSSP